MLRYKYICIRYKCEQFRNDLIELKLCNEKQIFNSCYDESYDSNCLIDVKFIYFLPEEDLSKNFKGNKKDDFLFLLMLLENSIMLGVI